jgi:hypothetical protein
MEAGERADATPPRRHEAHPGAPGRGQYDLPWILDSTCGRGYIRLNRAGTIQVHGRFRWPVETLIGAITREAGWAEQRTHARFSPPGC